MVKYEGERNKEESITAPKYLSAVLFVTNIETSKQFYSSVLKQKITLDLGVNVAFENGLAIWDKKYAHSMLYGPNGSDTKQDQGNSQKESEYYFEIDNIEACYDYLTKQKVNFIHPLVEQPWKQRVFRFYDPDHHIIEIGEPMPIVVIRLANQGHTNDEISKLTSMPIMYINLVMSQHNTSYNSNKANQNSPKILSFFQSQSIMSSPGNYSSLFDTLPNEIGELCKIIQANFNHLFITKLFGSQLYQYSIEDARAQKREPLDEVSLSSIEQFLGGMQQIKSGALNKNISHQNGHFAICRDYALMLVSMLRHQGIAARVRCGFATYLNPGFYEDHYVCEYYNQTENRWILVDPQLDRPVLKLMHIDFDPLDIPHEKFLFAGKVWQEMRLGNITPEKCGIMTIRGKDFVRANVLLDLACLNKVEPKPWDTWGIKAIDESNLTKESINLIDKLAKLTANVITEFEFIEIQQLYQDNSLLTRPADYKTPHFSSTNVII